MERDKVKFSIITATKNASIYLQSCIESVTPLLGLGFEHIIVDGGSTDGTREMLTENPHPNRLLFETMDRNLYEAFNFGLKQARGTFIMFIGADDEIITPLAKRLPLIVSAFESIEIFAFGVIDHNEFLTFRPRYPHLQWTWLMPRFLCHSGLVVHRDCYIEVDGFSPALHPAADLDAIQRIVTIVQPQIRYVKAPLVLRRLGGIGRESGCRNFEIVRRNFGILRGFSYLFIYHARKVYRRLTVKWPRKTGQGIKLGEL